MAGEMSNVDTCLVAEQSSETDVSGLGLDCRVNKSRKSVRVVDGAQEMLPSGGEPEDKLQSEAGFTQAEVDAMRSKKVVTLDVSALMKRPQHRSPQEIACLQQILLKVKFMPNLPQAALLGIAKQLEHRQLPSGATIIRQGDVGEEFFVVLRGVVTVIVRDQNGVENQVAELGEGASFGELALSEPCNLRRATCICKEECSFAVIHKRVYDELLRGQSGQVLEDKMQLLNIVPVLRQVPIEAMRLMMLHATMREFAPGSLILNQDQEVDDLYVIVRGNVKHIRELQKEKDNANCSADFWRHGTSDPFSKQPKASNSKYEHIKSPVAAYCKDPSSLKRRRSRAQRKALLESGRAKLRRAVAKILDARQRGLLRVVNKAATETKKILPPHLARAFRHSTKMEEDDRLFLEIATAGRGDYFGEQSVCSKVPKSSTSVIAASCVSVLLLHKWDVLNSVETSLLAELPRYSVVGSINDELLVEQFYRHERWQVFRKEIVASVLREREVERMARPKVIWQAFRASNTDKILSTPWR